MAHVISIFHHFNDWGWVGLKSYHPGLKLWVNYTKTHGAEAGIEFYKKSIEGDPTEIDLLTFKLIRALVDQDEKAVSFFLDQYREPSVEYKVENNAFWNASYDLFNVDLRYPRDPIFSYIHVLRGLPGYFVNHGAEEAVKDMVDKEHPYKNIYQLSEDVRPTGQGFSVVTIDEFHNPQAAGHPDKEDYSVILPDNPEWQDHDKPSHGNFVSTLSVGDRRGIAPDTKLYMIPFNSRASDLEFVSEITNALERIVEEIEKDPSIIAVGMSLGMEVPNEFRDLVKESVYFQRLERSLQTLDDMDIAIIVSSGNEKEEGFMNTLGFLPGILLIGGMVSNLTAIRDDDRGAGYDNDGDEENPVKYRALANPVYSYYGLDSPVFVYSGGTSSSRAHFTGIYVAIKSANPTLTRDEIYQIIDDTKDGSQEDPNLNSVHPEEAIAVAAHLPGNVYDDESREKLTQELLGISSVEFQKLLEAESE